MNKCSKLSDNSEVGQGEAENGRERWGRTTL